MTTKQVTTKNKNELAPIDFAADAGGGFEEADKDSYAIPYLIILQSGSPQCKKSDGAYIPGAEEGKFMNSVNEFIFDGEKGITVVPCHFTRSFNEWTPRGEGGGLVAVHPVEKGEQLLETCSKDDKGKDLLPNGNLLVDTRNHYLMQVSDSGECMPLFMPMSSTQIKKSKKWMTIMQNIRIGDVIAPMFSQVYKLTTTPESNDHGSWFGLKVEHITQIKDAAVYQACKDFRELVRSGVAKPQEAGDDTDY